MSFLRTLALVLIVISLPSHGAETRPNRCAAIRRLSAEALANVKGEFLEQHDTKYTYKVDAPAVRNQCQYGDCWTYSTVGALEAEIHQATGKHIRLSEQYIVAHDLMVKTWASLRDPKDSFGEGGFVIDAERIIRNFGAVPAEAWQPRVDFEKRPHPDRLMIFLKNRIAQFHEATKRMEDGPEKDALRRAAAKDVRDILDVYLGDMPQTFKFEGRNYTPREFAEKFLPFVRRMPLVVYPVELQGNKPSNGRETMEGNDLERPMHYNFSFEDWPEIENRVIESLKNGQAIPLSFEVVDAFIDDKTGIMSLAAFHTPDGFKPVEYKLRKKYEFAGGGHAIEIVGVDLDESGHIRKLKLRNSWGAKHGDNGFYHMYADYFRAYLQELYFR